MSQSTQVYDPHSKTPIHRLPDEILEMIFWYSPAICYYDELYCEFERDPPLSIMLTCRRWHRLYTGYPEVWTNIPESPLHLFRVYLHRSKQTPISVDLCLNDDASHQIAQEALQHLHRIRDLDIYVDREGDYGKIAPTINSNSADQLETFQVYTVHNLMEFQIDDRIFYGECPKLREVLIKGEALQFRWDNHIFSNRLVSLSISSLSLTQLPSPDSLLPILQCSSHTLRKLELHDVLNSFRTSDVDSPPAQIQVSLPELRELSLFDASPSISQFLSHIQPFPHDDQTVLISARNIEADGTASLQHVDQIVDRLRKSCFKGKSHSSTMGIRYSLRPSYRLVNVTSDDRNRPTNFSFAYAGSRSHLSSNGAILSNIASNFRVESVQTLIVYEFDAEPKESVQADQWSEFLREFVALKRLELVDAPIVFASALGQTGPGSLPYLQELVVETVCNLHLTKLTKFSSALVDALARRHRDGCSPLQTMELFRRRDERPESLAWAEDLLARVGRIYAGDADEDHM